MNEMKEIKLPINEYELKREAGEGSTSVINESVNE